MSIALPAVKFQTAYPQIIRSVSASRDGGGRAMAFTEYADPYWSITMRTKPLKPADRLLVEAFDSEASNGLVTVLYTPKHMCLPRAYWGNSSAAALANTGVISVKTSARQFTFNSVDNGLTLAPGDLIGLVDGDYKLIVRVTSGGIASGNALSVTVEPPLPAYIGVGATVVFKNPEMNTRVLPGSLTIPDEPLPVCTFTLVEVPK